MKARELRRLATEDRSAPLAASFEAAARAARLLDVAVGSADTPMGRLLVAVTARGLVRVAFPEEEREVVLEELSRRVSPRVLESIVATDHVRRELEEFFARRRRRFDVTVDRRLLAGFQRRVLAATARIPFGSVRTYGELAARIGHPGAARAVGNALAANPVPIVIPCHRVVRAGGDLGGYGGGARRKAELLELEGVARFPG